MLYTVENIQRRAFFGRLGLAAAAGAVVSAPVRAAQPALSQEPVNPAAARITAALEMRLDEAAQDAMAGAAVNQDNGDQALYADHGGTYTKALPHDAYGRVDPNAFATFMTALKSGQASDFEKIALGGTRTLNGPQGGLCFDLEIPDGVQFGQPQVPPAPQVAGDQTAIELVEHYWAALLRDVNFADYPANALAAQAAAELSAQPTYAGPRDNRGQVSPDLLFRGGFPGESFGPYVSQFMYLPAFLGSQPVSQQQLTALPDLDYATDWASWLDIQNGVDTMLRNQLDPQLRYRRNGRDLASLTHVDVLFQEYLVAFLVLMAINPAAPGSFGFGGAPLNPGNPYLNSKTQNGFGTFGFPDISATIEEVAVKALNTVWYQKWFVHLRPRPEAIGGIVHLIQTGQQDKTAVTLSPVILNSQALAQSYKNYGSYLLAQAFPEGSPAHPAYPTGHGTVAGACITVLKFFFDGSFVIPNPVMPSPDGLALAPYTGAGAGQLTVNGELNKLGHNVTFGHGIHAGIHWRSDSDASLMLGEAVALRFLANRARTYNEPFTVNITKFDGSTATISNIGPNAGI